MDKVKQWKPGQIVTVKRIVCRVTKGLGSHYPECCAFHNNFKVCDDLCKAAPPWKTTKVPINCYLKKLLERRVMSYQVINNQCLKNDVNN